jgi:hypothetical protein
MIQPETAKRQERVAKPTDQHESVSEEFSSRLASMFRSALFLGTSAILGAGCVNVESLQVTEPKPTPPPAPTAPALPEGPHWETPILTGYERNILVKNGERVTKGASLVEYSGPAIRLSEIQVEQLSLSVQDTSEQFERLSALRRQNAASQVEFESAETAFRNAQLKLEAERIRLDTMRAVKAPFDGIVRIDSTSNSPSISVYPDGGSEVLRNFGDASAPPLDP